MPPIKFAPFAPCPLESLHILHHAPYKACTFCTKTPIKFAQSAPCPDRACVSYAASGHTATAPVARACSVSPCKGQSGQPAALLQSWPGCPMTGSACATPQRCCVACFVRSHVQDLVGLECSCHVFSRAGLGTPGAVPLHHSRLQDLADLEQRCPAQETGCPMPVLCPSAAASYAVHMCVFPLAGPGGPGAALPCPGNRLSHACALPQCCCIIRCAYVGVPACRTWRTWSSAARRQSCGTRT